MSFITYLKIKCLIAKDHEGRNENILLCSYSMYEVILHYLMVDGSIKNKYCKLYNNHLKKKSRDLM